MAFPSDRALRDDAQYYTAPARDTRHGSSQSLPASSSNTLARKAPMRAPSALFVCTLFAMPAQAQLACDELPGMMKANFEAAWTQQLPAPDYLGALNACIPKWRIAVDMSSPPSPWLESQRAAYATALKKQRVDILVAPFQDQGFGIERAQRAVMSADLAYHLAERRVADPFLTARALGEGARRYARQDIVNLARDVGAQTVVVGYVGHDGQHRMTVTVEVLKIDGDNRVQKDWRDVAFTDDEPPFVVFHRMLPSVLESLSLGGGQQPRTAVTFPTKSSFSFVDLAGKQPDVGASVGLSLLGALSSSADELSRERLAERVLVTSWHFDAAGNDATFVRAYALLNLEQRPAALALLAGSTLPESIALRALLNGDLPGAAAGLPKVTNPLKRLLLALHVDDRGHQYGKANAAPATDPLAMFGEAAPDWLALAATRMNDRNPWQPDPPEVAKWLLDGVYPVAG